MRQKFTSYIRQLIDELTLHLASATTPETDDTTRIVRAGGFTLVVSPLDEPGYLQAAIYFPKRWKSFYGEEGWLFLVKQAGRDLILESSYVCLPGDDYRQAPLQGTTKYLDLAAYNELARLAFLVLNETIRIWNYTHPNLN